MGVVLWEYFKSGKVLELFFMCGLIGIKLFSGVEVYLLSLCAFIFLFNSTNFYAFRTGIKE